MDVDAKKINVYKIIASAMRMESVVLINVNAKIVKILLTKKMKTLSF
jgi:hypothetical protein